MSCGSVWRKWDLHIHAPGTIFNDQFSGNSFEDEWDRYLSEIERHVDIAVLGITDYFSLQCYEDALDYWKNGRMPGVKLLIPNIELRILPTTESGKAVNLHLLVNPQIVSAIETQLFSQLKFHYKGNDYTCQNVFGNRKMHSSAAKMCIG